MPPLPKLGLIAGGGALPSLIIAACRASGRPHFVAALTGSCARETIAGVAHGWFDIAAVGGLVAALRAADCREAVLAGTVRRPDFAALRPDWQGVKLLPRVVAAAARGDDALLRTLIVFLEEQGFAVRGADELVGDLLATAGRYGRLAPSASALADIALAAKAARELGRLDRGQAAVARDGALVGVEDEAGTDALLARCGARRFTGQGGVLVKAPKPGQERRVDLPTIGIGTVEKAAAVGLAGIAIEAGGVFVIDRIAVAAAADAAGLFVYGFNANGDA